MCHIILCEVCDEPIVQAHLAYLKRPLMGDMFLPLAPGYDVPWVPETGWQWMRCPHCGAKPFVVSDDQAARAAEGRWDGPETVKTTQGIYRIGTNEYPGMDPVRVTVPVYTDDELEREWEARIQRDGNPVNASEPPVRRPRGRPRKRLE